MRSHGPAPARWCAVRSGPVERAGRRGQPGLGGEEPVGRRGRTQAATPCSPTTRSKRHWPAGLAQHPRGPEGRWGRAAPGGDAPGRAAHRRSPARPGGRLLARPCGQVRSSAVEFQNVPDPERRPGRRAPVLARRKRPRHLGLAPHALGRTVGEALVHDRPELPVPGDLCGSALGHLDSLAESGR
jgi:hypothetical protein